MNNYECDIWVAQSGFLTKDGTDEEKDDLYVFNDEPIVYIEENAGDDGDEELITFVLCDGKDTKYYILEEAGDGDIICSLLRYFFDGVLDVGDVFKCKIIMNDGKFLIKVLEDEQYTYVKEVEVGSTPEEPLCVDVGRGVVSFDDLV
jgi:hypothetical protein